MTNKAKQESALAKGQRFTAIDARGRDVKGVCLDVMPWAKWPLRCYVKVAGVLQIQLYSAAELNELGVQQ